MTSRGPPAVPSRPTSGPRTTLWESLLYTNNTKDVFQSRTSKVTKAGEHPLCVSMLPGELNTFYAWFDLLAQSCLSLHREHTKVVMLDVPLVEVFFKKSVGGQTKCTMKKQEHNGCHQQNAFDKLNMSSRQCFHLLPSSQYLKSLQHHPQSDSETVTTIHPKVVVIFQFRQTEVTSWSSSSDIK